MSLLDEHGYSIKSRLANAVLALCETEDSPEIMLRLLRLEHQLLHQQAGPAVHASLDDLFDLLHSASTVFREGSATTRNSFCDSMEDCITAWQMAENTKGVAKMKLKDFFNKDARDSKKREQMILVLRGSQRKLNGITNNLNAVIDKDEKELTNLKEQASLLPQQSSQYNRLKSNYDVVFQRKRQNENLLFQANSELTTLTNQLSILESEATMTQIHQLMPLGLEQMELQTARSVSNIETMVEQAALASESAQDKVEALNDIMHIERQVSSFDTDVAQMKQAQEVLKVLEVTQPAIEEPAKNNTKEI